MIAIPYFRAEVYEGGSATPDPFDVEALYAPLLGLAHELCRVNHMPVDMAEDFVHETYIRFRVVDHDGWSREQNYEALRKTLTNLVEYTRRRRRSVHGLWRTEGEFSYDALVEQGWEG